jgi:hypothetical protein
MRYHFLNFLLSNSFMKLLMSSTVVQGNKSSLQLCPRHSSFGKILLGAVDDGTFLSHFLLSFP